MREICKSKIEMVVRKQDPYTVAHPITRLTGPQGIAVLFDCLVIRYMRAT